MSALSKNKLCIQQVDYMLDLELTTSGTTLNICCYLGG